MNLVGKIFIVLIFVMSILFMGFVVAVYAAHQNWRDLVINPDNGLQKQLDDKEIATDRLAADLDDVRKELEEEQTNRVRRLAQLQDENLTLTEARDQQSRDLARLTQEVRDAVASVTAAHETLATLRTEVVGLREEIAEAEKLRDMAITGLVDKTDQANDLALRMQTLNERTTQVAEQLAAAEQVLLKYNLDPNPTAHTDTPAQPVFGVVLAVRQGGIEVSIGSDDGLQAGHQLEAYRVGGGNPTYLGRLQVIRTSPDKAVCKILPQYQQGTIQANDRVSTGLKSQ